MNLSRRLAGASFKPLVLSLLSSGPKYGFQIVHTIQILSDERLHLPNSKLYPLLHSLEQDALVEAFWKPSETGPDRKYYRLTTAGATSLAGIQAEWNWMHSMFSQLWSGEVSYA